MANKKTSVFAIFPSVSQAERAVDALVRDTFTNDDVSVLLADSEATRSFAHEKQTKAPEGTTAGVATGGAIGGTLGLLAGILFLLALCGMGSAPGIVNVMANDVATAKEQKITISISSGLTKQDVERLVKDAESHAADDKSRRDAIDTRNQADSLVYQVEKTINEHRDKIAVGELSRVEAAIADVRKSLEGNDVDALKRATDALQRASHALAEGLYKGSQGSQRSEGSHDSNVKDGEVVDAEYAETK